jgi:alpha-beta hydrolase superfamily lysophospholipase
MEAVMKASDFTFIASDGHPIFIRRWAPAGTAKAALLVIHGMAEHSARYERLAEVMTQAGWAVYAQDLRGHGRTAGDGELGWIAERDGFRRIRDDIRGIVGRLAEELGGLPLFLLGHSMGSLLAETYIAEGGTGLSGCVLSGVLTPPPPALLAVGRLIAAVGALLKGGRAKSPLLHEMSFGANNRYFANPRTGCDWLSRDAAEVDKYLADPLCGFVCSFAFYRDLFSGLSLYFALSPFSGIEKDMPIYVFAGAEDPLGGAKGFVPILAEKLKAAGARSVDTRLYPGARHETLNESNRDEVMADVRDWLESRLRSSATARSTAP